MKREIIGCTIIVLGMGVFIWALYLNSVNPNTSVVISDKYMLESTWKNYKRDYVDRDTGRTIDRQRADITTSEGVAYTMLRSVWMDDKEMFDLGFQWANENLSRPNDALYSWLYGERDDGTLGILVDQGGINTASDGDTDIAMALIFAYGRWGQESYLTHAQDIMADIWRLQVVDINGVPYLTANDIERLSEDDTIVINPSYLSPAAYRIFAQYDQNNPWHSLVDSSYSILTRVTEDRLDTPTSASIPPDWVMLSKETGMIIPFNRANLTTNFSYDALRVPWRVALDYIWFREDDAKIYLSRLGFLNTEWKRKGALASVYGHDGAPIVEAETPAMYAGTLGYFMVIQPASATEIYERKLLFLYDADTNDWKTRLGYYDDNMVWFALAMYNNLLPNLDEKTYDQQNNRSEMEIFTY